MAVPRISVLLLAHHRKEFVAEAVASVDRSARALEGVERIVVKSFVDPSIDDPIERSGWRLISGAPDPLGAKVALGLRNCTGDVVTFLEDDDAYEPERLPRVSRAFGEDPALSYYRNGQRFVGPDGQTPAQPDGKAARNLQRLGSVRAGAGALTSIVPELSRIDPDFNLSSIAVRRDAILGELSALEPLNAAVDSAVFYAALRSGGGVRIDAERLTRYRVHSVNASLLSRSGAPEAMAEYLRYQQRFLTDFEPTVRLTTEKGPEPARRLAQSALAGSQLLFDLLSPGTPRRRIAGDLGRFWRRSPAAKLRDRPDLSYYGLLGLIAPGASRRSYARRRGIPNP
ncbi:MAG: glycosyltransferase [Thermoplasmata archaeon]|nr:glycosyltransferase [Thermoplasmata archaeon]